MKNNHTQKDARSRVFYVEIVFTFFVLVLGISASFAQAPPAPVATAATNITATSFDANWGVSTGAITYFLDVSTDVLFGSYVGTYQGMNVGNVTTFTVTGVTPLAACYYYQVRAYSVGNVSAASNIIAAGACGTTEFAEVMRPREMRVYPNPVKDRLFLQINKTENTLITISDVLGKNVKTVSPVESISDIDVATLENGIYYIKVKQAECVFVQQIIVNR